MEIKNNELDYLRQALYAGISERVEASRRDKNEKMTAVDNEIISVYEKIIKRIEKAIEKKWKL